MLIASDLHEWKQHPVTKQVMELVQERLDACLASVVNGEVIGDTADQTAMSVSRLAGNVAGLTYLLEIEGDENE